MHNKKNRDYKSLIETNDNNLQLVFLFITQERLILESTRLNMLFTPKLSAKAT